jgi:hypothetical protein
MVCPQCVRRSAHHRREDYGDRLVEGPDDAIDLAVISPSSRSAGDALSQIRIYCVDEIAATCHLVARISWAKRLGLGSVEDHSPFGEQDFGSLV